jgi:hypothetical protein
MKLNVLRRYLCIMKSVSRFRCVVCVTFFGVCCLSKAKSGGTADGIQSNDGPYFSNCGFNCVVEALVRYRKTFNVEDITRLLKVGTRLACPTSFKEMKSVLEKYNFSVVAVQDASASEIIGWVKAGRMIIAQIDPYGNRKQYHFLCLYTDKPSEGTVMVADYPQPPRKVPEMAAWAGLESISTGNVLIFDDRVGLSAKSLISINPVDLIEYRGKPIQRQPVAFEVGNNENADGSSAKGESRSTFGSINVDSVVDLGQVSRSMSKAIGKIVIKNTGEHALHITGIVGGCSCFLGYKGPPELDARCSGTYSMEFSAANFGGSLIRQKVTVVAIKSDDASVPLFQLPVVAEPIPVDQNVVCAPSSYDGGVQRAKALMNSPILVKLFVPINTDGKAISLVKIDFPTDKLDVSPLNEQDETIGSINWRVLSYQVVWKRPPSGPYEETVLFEFSDVFNSKVPFDIHGICQG